MLTNINKVNYISKETKVSAKNLNDIQDSVLKAQDDIEVLGEQFNTIESNKATKQELEVEKNRITNLATLTEGSTTGDAELIDVRVGIDGKTYSNAGTAIRTQISNIKPTQIVDEYYTECEGTVTKTGYITGYDVSTKEIIVSTSGHTDVIKVAIKKSDIFKTIVPDSQYVWGKVLTFVDSSNKYVYWFDRDRCIGNTLSYCKYDIDTKILTFDTTELLSTYNNITHVYIAYKNDKPSMFATYDISNFKWLTNINYDKKNEVDIILPSKIHGVVGKELNIYYDNILKNVNINGINSLKVNKFGESEVLNNRCIINPTSNGIRDLKFSLYRNNLLDLTKVKNIKLNIVDESVGTGTKKVLIIGDSKVQGGFISQTLKENIDNDSSTMKCELLGTKYTWSETNKHEGRGGWSSSYYLTKTVAEGNPFYNNGFDFTYYMTQQGYSSVDYVFINLGTNDVSQLSSTGINTIISNYKTMINSIKTFNSNVKVIIGLCEGVYSLADTNSTNELKWDVNNNIDLLHEALITNFDNRESEKIYLCPMYLNMDLENDYNFEEVPLSSRDTTKKRMKCTDPVHQSSIGYRKCADVMYYTLKYIESLT